MKNILTKIRSLITRPRTMMVMGLIAIGILFPQMAFAATDTTNEIMQELQELVNTALSIVHALFWPILLLIGGLMDNDLIFGPEIGERLREIWVIIRNIVNIIFVFLLLVIAFANVIGVGGDGNFSLKTILPKFLIALVAVNFSFLACKVILDAANVVSMSVFDIAGSVEEFEGEEFRKDIEREICTDPVYLVCESGGYSTDDAAADAASSTGTDKCASADPTWKNTNANVVAQSFCCSVKDMDEDSAVAEACATRMYESGYTEAEVVDMLAQLEEEKEDLKEEEDIIIPAFNDSGVKFFEKLDQNNIGIVMAINLGSLNKITEVVENDTVTFKDFTINSIFSVIMYLVFGFAYVALFLVLLARLVVLWLVIALSPVIALTYVVPQLNQYTGDLNMGEKFIQHLLAPIVIGLSMSVGLLVASKVSNTGQGGVEISGVGNQNFAEITTGNNIGSLAVANISDIQQLMVAAIAVAVVWLGVFGAADKTLASSITNPIKDFGTNAAKFLAKLPTYAPIVPVMGKEGTESDMFSVRDMGAVLNRFKGVPETLSQKKVEKWWGDNMGESKSEAFIDSNAALASILNNSDATGAQVSEKVNAALKNVTNEAEFNDFRENMLKVDGMNKDWIGGSIGEFETKWNQNKASIAGAIGVGTSQVDSYKRTTSTSDKEGSSKSTDDTKPGSGGDTNVTIAQSIRGAGSASAGAGNITLAGGLENQTNVTAETVAETIQNKPQEAVDKVLKDNNVQVKGDKLEITQEVYERLEAIQS